MKKEIVHTQVFQAELSESGFPLRCGKSLPELELTYETYGSLNADSSNAILVCHALTGSAHLAGYNSEDEKKPGWWDEQLGPGKAFDTDKYFIVCSNILGSCYGSTGPVSINPKTGKLYNKDFPVITIADMVNAQELLRQDLKVDKWLCVVGGSLGGMQALQWAVAYPDRLHACMPIATTAQLSPQAIAFNWVGREAILADPKFLEGNYGDEQPDKGLAIARMIAHITYLSDSSMREKFGRRLQSNDDQSQFNYDFDLNFQVESYLNYQGSQFVNRFDANAYLYISRAMDYFNLSEEAGSQGSLAQALEAVSARFCIVSFTSDWLFPPYQSMEIVQALQSDKKEVTFCNIKSDYGHDAFLLENETLGKIMTSFLSSSQETYRGYQA